ncbi:MAG: hypothetical protein D6805_01310 [Planctomycetota bacterium]|nr:MAG: hypothetical protein D6805_01310 [Planctomycetota bacterium]
MYVHRFIPYFVVRKCEVGGMVLSGARLSLCAVIEEVEGVGKVSKLPLWEEVKKGWGVSL